MERRLSLAGLFWLLATGLIFLSLDLKTAWAAPSAQGSTLVLYDAASGTLPDPSLMSFTDFPPGTAALMYSDRAAVLDTISSGSDTYAGWVSGPAIAAGFPLLDRNAGFQVNFTVQVESEMHENDRRAGFSVIVLDQQAKGIELAFWEDEIWAQNDDSTGGLFTHGEGAAFATTAGPIQYQLVIAGEQYTLTANSLPLLSGPVRDYSRFDGFPDPYETPGFLFLGDNTSSSQARLRLGFVSVTGSENLLPAAASTGTSSPVPPVTLTPLPSLTPIPSPTPTGAAPDLCLSPWMFLAAAGTGALVRTRTGRQTKNQL